MTLLEAIISCLVRGLTEILPVSSSGHIQVGNNLLRREGADSLMYAVVVHSTTTLSTIVIFGKDICNLVV